MLRWLRSPRLLVYLALCFALCLSLLLPPAPIMAQTPVPQALVPQTLNFVNGVAQVQGAISSNQPQDFVFFGTQGQTVRVQLQSQQTVANFEVTGANNVTYKQFGDPSRDWSFTLPVTQNYRITVNSLQPAVYTLIVTLNGGGGGTAQPLNFVNGVAQVSGTASFGQSLQYVFSATGGQQVHIVLISAGNIANFSVNGVTDNITYKSPADPSRDWTFTLPTSQNYLITVSAPSPVSFTLQVTLQGVTPPAQPLNFVNGVAQVSGTASFGQSLQYVFSATGGQQVHIVLISAGNIANFSVNGVTDNITYKSPADPSRDWTFTLPTSQNYLITVSAPSPVSFTLQVTRGVPLCERIEFLLGQTTATKAGNLQPNLPKCYIFGASPAVSPVTILLTPSPADSAGFAVSAADNGQILKNYDGQREWTLVAPRPTDYVITLLAPNAFASYQLQVTITPPLPPPPSGCITITTPLQNGGFESNGFWVFGDDPVPPAYASAPPPVEGLRSVRLGIDPALGPAVQNKKSFSSIRQPILIPAEAIVAQLRWSHLYRTEEGQTDDPGPGTDQQQVILLNPDLSTHAVLVRVRRNDNAWVPDFEDLTSYIGKPLVLYFNVYNDGNGQRTWQFVDNVSILACGPNVAPTPFAAAVPMEAIVMPTLAFPTPDPTFLAASAAMTVPLPAMVAAALTSTTSTPMPTLLPTQVSLLPGAAAQVGKGEPEIVMLPTAQPGVAAAVVQGTQVQAAAVQVQIQPTLTPVPPVTTSSGPLIFNRPLTEVLTWLGIMLGALAVIGILAALIWQASQRNDTIS